MRYDVGPAEALTYHRDMLADTNRMDAFFRAIMEVVQPGDVVVDIGTGTSVLAHFACMAGARKVYAVEQGDVGDLAAEVIAANRYADRIELVREWSTAVELPEPADVLVTETIGNAAFDEGIIGWVADARRRLLRAGAVVVPRRVRLIAAPIDAPHDYVDVEQWSKRRRGIDFSAGRARAAAQVWDVDLSPVHVICAPVPVAEVDLTEDIQEPIEGGGSGVARRAGTVHGLGCWFEADLTEAVSLTNAPPTVVPSWAQAILPVVTPSAVEPEDRLVWSISLADNGASWSSEVRLEQPA